MRVIYGIGIDFVEVSRAEKILERWGERFTFRVYSPFEIAYCKKQVFPTMHYAARFAAKESFLKAAGIGLWMGIRLKDIEVLSNREGGPEIKLHAKARDILRDNGISAVHLSLSHTAMLAVAMVILEQ